MSRIFAELVSWKLGGNRPSLIDRCQILSPIQQSSLQQCTGVTFQSSSALVSVALIKSWLQCTSPFFNQCSCYVDIPQLDRLLNISLIWLYTIHWILSEWDLLFRLRSSYRIRSSLIWTNFHCVGMWSLKAWAPFLR